MSEKPVIPREDGESPKYVLPIKREKNNIDIRRFPAFAGNDSAMAITTQPRRQDMPTMW
jgi:hypothetical protein